MNQHKNNSIANDKPHGLIPFYIPHAGCPQQCVFCNQHRIAAGGARASEVDVKATIDEYIGNERHEKYWEVAFYGGSFSALPEDLHALCWNRPMRPCKTVRLMPYVVPLVLMRLARRR